VRHSNRIAVLALMLFAVLPAAAQRGGVVAPEVLRAPGSPNLPLTCRTGDLYVDTDATAGRRFYGCEATDSWVLIASEEGASGIASVNGLTADTQTFADVDDSNVQLTITSGGSTHTFTLTWTGRLALARLVQGNALSVLGVTGASTADYAAIAASLDGQVLRRNGSTLSFGVIDLANTNTITGVLPDANSASTLARDSEVTTAVTNHSASGDHDGRYYTETELGTNDGTINQGGDYVSWNKLKDVPAGFADGDDGGGGGGGLGTVREVDASPSVGSVVTLEADQAVGFVVTDQGSGVVRISLAAIPDSAISNTLTCSIITDPELSSIAGLTSAADTFPYYTGSGTAALQALTSFIRTLLDDANVGAARTTLGLGTLAVQSALLALADHGDLCAANEGVIRNIGDSANVCADVVTETEAAANFQPRDAELLALAAVTSAADRVPYFTGSGAAALATMTAFARSILDDIDATGVRGTLGLGTLAVLSQLQALADLGDLCAANQTTLRNPSDSGNICDDPLLAAEMNTFGEWLLQVGVSGTCNSTTLIRGDGTCAAAGNGDLVGPASSTDNVIPRFDGTLGKLLQQGTGAPSYDDTGNVTVETVTSRDQTTEPGNLLRNADNDTALTNDPTCANSGIAGFFTWIDSDESSADRWDGCDGTTLYWRFPTPSTTTAHVLHASSTSGAPVYGPILDAEVPSTLTGKTIDAGDAGAGSTRPSGGNVLRSLTHNTDCTTLTIGKQGEHCTDEDDGKLWTCIPTAGDCDTAGEWKRFDASGGSGVSNIPVHENIASPTSATDRVVIFTTEAINVDYLNASLTGTTSVTWDLVYARAANETSVLGQVLGTDTVTSSASGQTVSITNAVVPKNVYLRLKASAASGTPTNLFAQLSYSAASAAQCNDGVDNDSGNGTDYPADPGCSSSTDNTEATTDTTAPSAIGNTYCSGSTTPLACCTGSGTGTCELVASAPTTSQCTLTWTTTGDDTTSGTPTSYDCRVCAQSSCGATMDDTEFNAATGSVGTASGWQLTGEPSAAAAGSSRTFAAGSLTSATAYTFACKVSDEIPNTSAISNSGTCTTGSGGSANVMDETFDGTGYSLGLCGSAPCWTESGTTANVNEDSTTCGSGSGWLNQCLRLTGGEFDNPVLKGTIAAQAGDLYVSEVMNLTWAADDTGDRWGVLGLDDATAETGGISVNAIYVDAVTISLRLYGWSSGGVASTLDTASFTSASNVCLEIYMNSDTNAWEWKINGVSEGAGTFGAPGFSVDPTTVHYGTLAMPGGSTADLRVDRVKVSNSGTYPTAPGWVGCP